MPHFGSGISHTKKSLAVFEIPPINYVKNLICEHLKKKTSLIQPFCCNFKNCYVSGRKVCKWKNGRSNSMRFLILYPLFQMRRKKPDNEEMSKQRNKKCRNQTN